MSNNNTLDISGNAWINSTSNPWGLYTAPTVGNGRLTVDVNPFYGVSRTTIFTFLKEEEYRELLEKVKERASKEEFLEIYLDVVSSRHFSEKFIMDFLPDNYDEYKSRFKQAVLMCHSDDIKSGDYSEIFLLLNLNE